MGWSKRSSGNRYDSKSGHAMLFGEHTKKVLGYVVKCKECSTCNRRKNKDNIPEHDCISNYEGSSKSMEVQGILDLVIDAWDNKHLHISGIVTYDDTTMTAQLKHSYEAKIKCQQMKKSQWPRYPSGSKKADNGRLPIHITPPVNMADPSHRKKVVTKHLYKLSSANKSESCVQKCDSERLRTGYGYMLHQISKLHPKDDAKEIKKRGRAVLEHMFNNHRYCDVSWCYVLQSRKNKTTYTPPPGKEYVNKKE